MKNNPILITGSHRSGTTFVGQMLNKPKEVGYVFEPFNKLLGIEGVQTLNPYIKKGTNNEEYYRSRVEQLLAYKAKYIRLPTKEKDSFLKKMARPIVKSGANMSYLKAKMDPRVNRMLIKDPLISLSSEWLHQEFDMDVVVLFRHPAGFAGSLKRLNWKYDFRELLKQEELVETYFSDLVPQLEKNEHSLAEEAALLWLCIYRVLDDYIERNPGFIVKKHEDISLEPMKELTDLYKKVDLPFNKEVERFIQHHTADVNPTNPTNNSAHVLKRNSKETIERWKKQLSEDEIKTIMDITGELGEKYYPSNDWM